MQLTDIPGKVVLPWGNSAGGSFIRNIPVPSQIGITPGAASYTDGFVPLNADPISGGGIPPDIRDMNGILNPLSAWVRWQCAGGSAYYDGAFSTAVGGYPKGAVLQSATTPGKSYISTADNNTNNPDVTIAGWLAQSTQYTTDFTNGERTEPDGFMMKWGLGTVPPSGSSSESVSITFHTPFPNAIFGVKASCSANNSGPWAPLIVMPVQPGTLTGFTAAADTAGGSGHPIAGGTFFWEATGR